MKKAELLETIAKSNAKLSKRQISDVVDSLFAEITTTIRKDGQFAYPGFGSFKVRKRKARDGRNPQTGEQITIKASKTVSFRPAKALKERL